MSTFLDGMRPGSQRARGTTGKWALLTVRVPLVFFEAPTDESTQYQVPRTIFSLVLLRLIPPLTHHQLNPTSPTNRTRTPLRIQRNLLRHTPHSRPAPQRKAEGGVKQKQSARWAVIATVTQGGLSEHGEPLTRVFATLCRFRFQSYRAFDTLLSQSCTRSSFHC